MKDYQQHTDKYFLRSKLILEKENINPIVRYQVFTRKDIDCLSGVDEAMYFIKKHAPEAKVYALEDGRYVASCEPVMKIEGRVQDLIDLETVYLGFISGELTGELHFPAIYHNAYGIVKAARDKPVFYFGARHFAPEDDRMITHLCHEAGFAGCSTDNGATHWDSEGIGTVPHALILSVYAELLERGLKDNPTVETAKLFNSHISKRIMRTMLIDTFNREIDDTIECAKAGVIDGVRIDTCGENHSQGGDFWKNLDKDIPEKYLFGRGVTINSVWALKLKLHEIGLDNIKITVSSGFNPDKTAAFVKADEVFQEKYKTPLFDIIGTGSVYPGVVMATSDIVAYYSEKDKKWIEHHKVGRGENPSKRLKLV